MAKERQLELRKRQGELLEASEVESVWTQALTSFKNRLLSLPDKLAPRVAACPNVLECRAMIDQEVRKVLIALSETKADAE
jgi:DNA polymerase sigma